MFRILLISDMHYTTEETCDELKARDPSIKASLANGPILGYTQKERMEIMLRTLEKEAPMDAILVPGDLSIDDYDYRHLPFNFCEKFRDDCLSRFPAPTYLIPGNHDSYPNEIWQRTFGTPRQYAVELGGCLFLMADNYNAPVNKASGSPYTPFDVAWARREMEAHPDIPVFAVAHYFNPAAESPEFADFVKEPRVKALFMGHTHRYHTVELEGGKTIYDIGAFSYLTHPTNGVWDFNMFDPAWRWGYQILEIGEETAETYHVCPARVYHAHNGDFDCPEEIGERHTIKL